MKSVKPKTGSTGIPTKVRLKRIFEVWDLVLDLGPDDDVLLKALEEVEMKKVFSSFPERPYEVEVRS